MAHDYNFVLQCFRRVCQCFGNVMLKQFSKVAPKSERLDLLCAKICKERQVLNYRIYTHKKSLHSEVDNPVYDTCPSKMENHVPTVQSGCRMASPIAGSRGSSMPDFMVTARAARPVVPPPQHDARTGCIQHLQRSRDQGNPMTPVDIEMAYRMAKKKVKFDHIFIF